MLVLRCTAKAFKRVGSKPRAIEVSHSEPTLGEWYVNTVDFINDGDLLMACMHAESLYILLVPAEPDMNAETLVAGFQACLLARLIELDTPPSAAQRVLAGYQSTVLAKTTDRKITGHLSSALIDLEDVLDLAGEHLIDGNRLLIARIEHRLNSTPRALARRDCIWPLPTFWQCLRRLCPDLPARTPLHMLPLYKPRQFARVGKIIQRHLPSHLAGKLCAALQEVDVLYSAEELRILAAALAQPSALAHDLPSELAEDLSHQVRLRLADLYRGQP